MSRQTDISCQITAYTAKILEAVTGVDKTKDYFILTLDTGYMICKAVNMEMNTIFIYIWGKLE